MDFRVPASSERIRARMRELLAGPDVRAQLELIRSKADGVDGDPRPIYRRIGEAGLLAVTWPGEYGGAGGGPWDLCAVVEELTRHDVPLSLHFITTHIVGAFLLVAGSDEQRRRLLPPIARGELFASVLLTEPDAGSDLGALTTSARRAGDGGGWLVSGRKIFNNQSHLADYGLCLVRTSEEPSRYQGMSVFLVPLRAAGVRRRALPSLADEHFHDIEMTDVEVGPENVVGDVGQGWHLVNQFLGGERSGIDFYARGLRTMEAGIEALRTGGRGAEPGALEALGRLGASLDAGRWLALRVLTELAERGPDVRLGSVAKWHCSESGRRAAWWALEAVGPEATARDGEASAPIESAYRMAPMHTIAGGASETLLDTLAVSRLDDLDQEIALDPLQRTLRDGVRDALAEEDGAWERLVELGVPTFGVPVEAGGLGLGLAAEVVVHLELGRALLSLPAYRETAHAAGLLAAGAARSSGVLAGIAAGTHAVAAIGLAGCDELLPRRAWSAVVRLDRTAAGPTLALVELPDPRCREERLETLTGPAVRLRLDDIAGEAVADRDVAAAVAGARVRQAAFLTGVAETAVVIARDYAEDRRLFDRRLLDFQTVSHRLAALAGEIEGVTLLVHEAGWRCDAGEPAVDAARQALAAAADLALAATRTAVQLHGARGMLAGGRVERAYRLAAVEAVRLGLPGRLWREAGERRLGVARD